MYIKPPPYGFKPQSKSEAKQPPVVVSDDVEARLARRLKEEGLEITAELGVALGQAILAGIESSKLAAVEAVVAVAKEQARISGGAK